MPLDPRWLELIDEVAPRVLGRDDRRGDALAREVARLSELYTRERSEIHRAPSAPAARLRFFLPRDLPKIEGPLAELATAGALPAGPRWSVIDAGAGMGTSTLGLASFAQRAGAQGVDAIAIDADAGALDAMRSLCREAGQRGLAAPIALGDRRTDLANDLAIGDLEPADFVLVGLALNELYAGEEASQRSIRREALLLALARKLKPGGALIVIEPALREATRELQALRDRIAENRALSVFAPCPRAGPCPMLRRERDWCHDMLPFELPEALAKIARSAGLRAHRLTYAYLTLRAAGAPPLTGLDRRVGRIVGGPVEEKGRTEWDLCSEAGRTRLMQLDRERRDSMEGAARGTVLRFDRELEDEGRLRLRPDVAVDRLIR